MLFIRLLGVPQTSFKFLNGQVKRDGRVLADNEQQDFKNKSYHNSSQRLIRDMKKLGSILLVLF